MKKLSEIREKICAIFETRKKYNWKPDGNLNNFKNKVYKNYNQYLKHQASKLGLVRDTLIKEYDIKYREVLKRRLEKDNFIAPGINVLCLAARLGTEVKSFLDLECFAIGLDINPGKNNKYVSHGDFHSIHFPDKSTDIIFTNSLDHAYDIKKVISEIKRVLKSNGHVIIEIADAECAMGYFEATVWENNDDLIKIFMDNGFSMVSSHNFEYPWKGIHVCLLNKTR